MAVGMKAGCGLERRRLKALRLFVGGARCFICRGGRIQFFCPVPLFVEMVAGGGCLAAVGGGLLLQTRGLGRFDVSFGLGGAGLGAVSSASASRCLTLSVSSAASPRMFWASLWR